MRLTPHRHPRRFAPRAPKPSARPNGQTNENRIESAAVAEPSPLTRLGTGCRVLNAGVSGDNSRDLLARWEKDVDAKQPTVVFCLVGANDVWRHFDRLDPEKPLVTEEEYERNMTQICKKVERYERFVFIAPYFMERNRSDEMRLLTERYAAIMHKVAQKFGLPVLDAQKEFDAYMEHRSGMSISWDRVHPGAIGSMLLARMILNACTREGGLQ